MKHTTTKKEKECKHEHFVELHRYHDIDFTRDTYIVVTADEQEIGPELMQHAKILKCKCFICGAVFLAKLFILTNVVPDNKKI